MMFTDCYSLTASHLFHWNHPNSAFLPRQCVAQLCLRTGRDWRLSYSDAAMVLDDLPVAEEINSETRAEVSRMKESIGTVPGLAVILVGEREYSQPYKIVCLQVGIKSSIVRLAKDSTEEELLKSISRFNDDPSVHGIIVQSNLPSHMDEEKIWNAVSVEKDVEGVNPVHIGRLAMRGREPFFVRPKPKGCIELLHRHNFEIKGRRAVVIIGSNISFGMPAALLLQREDATITIINSRTKNPQEITREADIIVSAVGKANMIRGSWIKPGAVVIDVGGSLSHDPNRPYGFGLAGDTCYEEVRKVASAFTPHTTLGLYLLTFAMLLSNTLTSAKRIHNLK